MAKRAVLKFGGSSVSTPEQIRSIAQKVAARRAAGEELILVTSAMGKTTDSLIELAYKVSAHPNRRELDMLVSTGERVSMSLMSMALHDFNCPSISFTGSQAGIFTDGDFSNAKIVDIKPIRVDESLQQNKVIVLAGFQGVDPQSKEITTLGRGGSDTTAVAFAAHFKADQCEILKDVDGIYSVDPKLSSKAVLYDEIDIDYVLEFCFWGAKVLHYRSVELAKRQNVPLFVGSATKFTLGTKINGMNNSKSKPVQGVTMFENLNIAGVNSHKEVHHVKIAATDTSEAYVTFGNILREQHLPFPQILASAYENGACRLMYTADTDSLAAIRAAFSNSSKMELGKILASVTVTAFGAIGNGIAEKLSCKLREHKISIDKIVFSPHSISFFIDPRERERAIQALHP